MDFQLEEEAIKKEFILKREPASHHPSLPLSYKLTIKNNPKSITILYNTRLIFSKNCYKKFMKKAKFFWALSLNGVNPKERESSFPKLLLLIKTKTFCEIF